MKEHCRARIFLVLGLVVSTPAWAQQSGSDLHNEDAREIQAVDDATRRAAQARNAKDVVDIVYADDSSAMYPNTPICTGKEALYKRWSQMLATPGFSVDWHLTRIEISRSGDLAYTPFTCEMTLPGAEGGLIHDRGKGLAVWKKQADGKWKCEADIFNSDLPVREPAPTPVR